MAIPAEGVGADTCPPYGPDGTQIQLRLATRVEPYIPTSKKNTGKKKGLAACAARPSNIGRSGGIRTRDPLLPKQMRYQAALRSDSSYSNPAISLFLVQRVLFVIFLKARCEDLNRESTASGRNSAQMKEHKKPLAPRAGTSKRQSVSPRGRISTIARRAGTATGQMAERDASFGQIVG